jgi:hypothetical protein
MVNAGPALEVWELADDEPRTRTTMCWPDPEFQPHLTVAPERTEQFVREHIGRAEREATSILAEHSPVSPDKVHALVALAWGRGFVNGFGKGSETFAELLTTLSEGRRP